MPDTVAGLFRTSSEAQLALGKLEDAGFGASQVEVESPRVRRPGRFGLKVLIGIVGGAVLGALLAAVATGMVPGVHPLVAGSILVTFLFAASAGAVTGGVAGSLFAMAASGDPTLFYEQEVESGRVLVRVAAPRLEEARAILLAAGAMEAAPVEAPMDCGRPRPESG